MKALLLYAAMLATVVGVYTLFADDAPRDWLSEHQRRDIVARLHTEVLVGQLTYDMPSAYPPAVVFTLTGRNAAEASCSIDFDDRPDWTLYVNERMAARHWDDYLAYTIPHEAAHFVLCAQRDPQWKEHGARWETVVRELGAEPRRYHAYE